MERYSPVATTNLSDTYTNGQCVSSAAEAKLWFILQRKLYDRSACIKLKPLNVSREDPKRGAESKQVLDSGKSQIDEGIGDLDGRRPDAYALIHDSTILPLGPMTQIQDSLSNGGEDLEGILDDSVCFENHSSKRNRSDEDLFLDSFDMAKSDMLPGHHSDEDLFWSELDDDEDLLEKTVTSPWTVPSIEEVEIVEDELLDGIMQIESQSHRAPVVRASLFDETMEQPSNHIDQANIYQHSEMLVACGSGRRQAWRSESGDG